MENEKLDKYNSWYESSPNNKDLIYIGIFTIIACTIIIVGCILINLYS